MPIFYASKYQDNTGKWIYTQNHTQKTDGYKIIGWILNRWRPNTLYYHLRSGGHIEAIQHHLDQPYFLRIDLQDFYSHVSKSKIIRSLVKSGFKYKTAHDFAMRSTVRNPAEGANYILPFGFVQSPIIATMVLQKSLLGRTISSIKNNGIVRVSAYMDDILLSSTQKEFLAEAKAEIQRTAERSGFLVNNLKSTDPTEALDIFNIDISTSQMKVTEVRMQQFMSAISEYGACNASKGIIGYVNTVNLEQASQLEAALNDSAEAE